jgi:hypothetical protein
MIAILIAAKSSNDCGISDDWLFRLRGSAGPERQPSQALQLSIQLVDMGLKISALDSRWHCATRCGMRHGRTGFSLLEKAQSLPTRLALVLQVRREQRRSGHRWLHGLSPIACKEVTATNAGIDHSTPGP